MMPIAKCACEHWACSRLSTQVQTPHATSGWHAERVCRCRLARTSRLITHTKIATTQRLAPWLLSACLALQQNQTSPSLHSTVELNHPLVLSGNTS